MNKIFYHGTNEEGAYFIEKEGLQAGDNSHGGTHGIFQKSKLFLTEDIEYAREYGSYIFKITIDTDKYNIYQSFDMLREVFYMEGEDVLITTDCLELVDYPYMELEVD